MQRELMVENLRVTDKPWDIIVIGGGASGIGTAVDAASRNFRVLLLEKHDFSKGTSSRSTKLVHGGVRYLQQGDVSLVFEALRERGLLFQNAPHLVRNQSFVIPNYEWWGGPFYTVGLKVYDMMAGKLGFGPSEHLSYEETIDAIPTLVKEDLKGGVIYQDGQFDDSRLALTLAMTAVDYGATVLNYFPVTGLIKEKGLVTGVKARDLETGQEYELKARCVVNATGVFADDIRIMDDPDAKKMIQPSQGVHLVIDKKFLPGTHAVMVPHTSDGRVLFAVPWHNRVIVGTTDTVIDKPSLEPYALEEEIDFILKNASRYLAQKISRPDILSVFAGLRPLAAPEGDAQPTKEISRHHKILISVTGLITITGGKWTTYRKIAEDAVNNAIMVGNLKDEPCITEHLLTHSYARDTDFHDPFSVYGTDMDAVKDIEQEHEKYSGWLSESLGIQKSQVIWAVREEMARTVEDVLARRTRALFLDARESIRIAPQTGALMADVLGHTSDWVMTQLNDFKKIAKHYHL